MATMRTDGFSNLLNPIVKKVWFEYLKDVPPIYPRFINEGSMDVPYFDESKVSGLGTVPEKPEGSKTIIDHAVQGSTKRWTAVSYGLAFSVTRELWEDDQKGVIKRMSEALRRSVRHLYETQGHALLNNSTSSTTKYLGVDGYSLLNASHSALKTGALIPNMPSAHVDISYLAVQNAMLHFHSLVDDSGFPTFHTANMAIVAGSNQFNAAEIFLNGPMEFDTANNNKNFVTNGPDGNGITTVIFSRYFDDADAWFIASAKNQHQMYMYERTPAEYKTGDDFITGGSIVKTYMRLVPGFVDFRGWYGSTGA